MGEGINCQRDVEGVGESDESQEIDLEGLGRDGVKTHRNSRVKREDIGRQTDEDVRFVDHRRTAGRRGVDGRDLPAHQDRGQGVGQFVGHHVAEDGFEKSHLKDQVKDHSAQKNQGNLRPPGNKAKGFSPDDRHGGRPRPAERRRKLSISNQRGIS